MQIIHRCSNQFDRHILACSDSFAFQIVNVNAIWGSVIHSHRRSVSGICFTEYHRMDSLAIILFIIIELEISFRASTRGRALYFELVDRPAYASLNTIEWIL